MHPSELLRSIQPDKITGIAPDNISGITQDSRRVQEGFLFVAVPGVQINGNAFIPDALERGAAGVVVRTGTETNVPYTIEVPDPRASLADLSAQFYGRPSEQMKVVGVTGTDGKTTTSHLIRHLLLQSGYQVGILNTVYIACNGDEQKNPYSLTTPDSPDVQAFLASFLAGSDPKIAKAAVLEASSHAIALDRLRAVEFDAAVFTNLTSTHLEYHSSFEEYRLAKTRLFSELRGGVKSGPKFGVINADDESAKYFKAASTAPVIDYGINNNCQVKGEVLGAISSGSEFKVQIDGREYLTTTTLQGRFNVYNILASLSVAYGLGLNIDKLIFKIPEIGPVQGRMMEIQMGQPFRVIVDFAHTPGALRVVVSSIKEQNPKRLAVLIGHAGERDLGNRPELARATEGADMVFITMDDPGDEDPVEIAAVMADALRSDGKVEGQDYQVIVDRKAAIKEALQWAKPRDLVLVAGRGHEQFIPLGKEQIPFDDAVVTRGLLQEMGYNN
ncbi:UDP-N-acetylmuramoyl-L-alanyl-D-glutamate--2,6-diaminopimelate ligase [Candidatus Daviesbacteria bacterium]|nr:UDP-N-acetylmuramoyl-L-alanyl-D-glutamate--2,6-diaminopimelate ligase [Candidatus Daviesbacteria bacterium]